jgi:hypothetical protein
MNDTTARRRERRNTVFPQNPGMANNATARRMERRQGRPALKEVIDPALVEKLNAGPREVTDPALLAQLNAPPKEVTDPDLLAKLNGKAPDRPLFSMTETNPAKLSEFQSAISSGIQGFGNVLGDTLKAGAIADAKMGFIDKPEEGVLYQAGQWISDFFANAETNPEYTGELSDKIGQGVGSTGGFLAGGLAGGTAKGAMAAAGVMGAGSQATNQYMDALDKGASLEDAYNAAGLGGLVGTTEAIPIVRLLDRLDKGTNGGIKSVIINAAKGGTEEAVQEAFQSIASNLIASDLIKYDPERKIFESAAEGAGIGFGIGALFNTVASIFGLKGRRGRSADPASQMRPEPEIAETGEDTGQEPASGRQDVFEDSQVAASRTPPEQEGSAVTGVETEPTAEQEPVAALQDDAGQPSPDEGDVSFNRAPDRMAQGENFAGMRKDAPGDPASRDLADPVRRDKILKDFSRALDVPFYQGRIPAQMKAEGFHRKGVNEIRTRKANDIEVVAHEVAHMIDDRAPEIAKQYKANKVFRDELRGVSYDKKKIHEGFAEFVRLWSTQPEKAAELAPQFNGWFNDFVARNEYGPALQKARTDMTAWFDQDALKRARSKIGEAEEGLPTNIGGRLRQAVVDDLHGLREMENDLLGEITPVGLYETARLSRAKHSMIEGALTIGAPKVNADGSHSYVGKGLKQILEPVANRQEEFWTYAAGRSARELMGQGREHLFTKNEIDAMTKMETPAFRKAFDEYQAWNNRILDFAQAKGVINSDNRKMWMRAEYIPFYRVGTRGAKGNKGTEGNWKGIQRLTGGTENLQDIAKNVVQNAATLIDAALTNEVRLKAAQLASGPRGAKFMAKIPKDQVPVSVESAQIEKALVDAMGADSKADMPVDMQIMLDKMTADLGPFTEFILRGQAPQGGNIVAALENGKPVFFEVADPLVLRSLIGLNRPSKNWITKVLSLPKRLGQASITLTPDFMAANLARDTALGSIMSRSGFVPLLDSLRGIKSRVTQDQNYKDFIANGGGFSSYLVDEEAFTAHLEKFYTKKGINPHNVLNVPRKMFYALEVMADAAEMSTRLGEFRRARALGEHPRHAAYRAREVSTDFAMRGGGLRRGHELHDKFDDIAEGIGFMYDTVIFLKAAANGIDRTYRGFTQDKNKAAIAAKTGMLGLMSAALWYLNKDNPLYQDLEDWDKDTNWHFFVPKFDTPDDAPVDERFHHFRFPKLWEVGAVSSAAERTMEAIDKSTPLEGARNVANVALSTFGLEYIPQAFAPLYEVYSNRNRFTGRPVEGMAQEAVQPWARSNTSTSQTLRTAGETVRNVPGLNRVSPVQAQHLLRGYFNTWAAYGLSISDGIFFDNAPDLRVDQYPVIKRFYRQQPSRSSKAVGDFYDALKEATETRRTIKQLLSSDREAMAREQEFTEANRLYGPLNNAKKFMRGFSGEIRKVYNTKNLKETRKLAKQQSKITKGNIVVSAQRAGTWRSMGALKAMMLDNLINERNNYAKKVTSEIAKQRGSQEKSK